MKCFAPKNDPGENASKARARENSRTFSARD